MTHFFPQLSVFVLGDFFPTFFDNTAHKHDLRLMMI